MIQIVNVDNHIQRFLFTFVCLYYLSSSFSSIDSFTFVSTFSFSAAPPLPATRCNGSCKFVSRPVSSTLRMMDTNGDSNEEDITTMSSSSTEGASTTSTVDLAEKEEEVSRSENVDTVNNEKKEVPAITTSLSELKEEQEQFNAMYDNSNAMNQNSDEFDGKLPNARHLSFRKYLTMQEKRVVVTIRYSGSSGLKSMYLTAAAKIKQLHRDVLIIRDIVTEGSDENGTGSQNAGKKVFEILVDGKRVAGDKDLNNSRQKGNNMGMNTSGIVFVSMRELDVAINKSRKKRRPNTVYESEKILVGVSSAGSEIGDSSAFRLEYLKALSKKID